MKRASRYKQRGITLVEFAVVGSTAIIFIFGMIDVARAVSVWNQIQEAGRLAVRAAAVCPTSVNVSAIVSGVAPSGLTITVSHVLEPNPINAIDDFAQATTQPYVFTSVLPILSFTFPAYTFKRPLESGGLVPGNAGYVC